MVPVREEQSQTVTRRQRKSHAKSRHGCRNCKLRRVKCDEARPECEKCTDFGVTCNFDPKISDLQTGGGGVTLKPEIYSFQLQSHPEPKLEIPEVLYPPIQSTFRLDRELLDRFGRFYSRTALTIGTPKAAVFMRDATFEMCFSHPYLMHVAQTITAIHDRYLSTSPWSRISRLTPTESYHLGKAAALFNQLLSGPIMAHDRDAMWATAAMLGIASFATIEASCPEDAWPLKPSEPSDFEWIAMSEHKTAVWEVTHPSRPDSVFHGMAEDYEALKLLTALSHAQSALVVLPVEFLELYEIDESSTVVDNPYLMAVRTIVSLLPIQCERSNIVMFLNFLSHTQPRFKELLREKDPRALLLMVYWYAMVGDTVWWLERRTVLEGQAICLHLERYYPDETAIHELLKFPKQELESLIIARGDKWL